MLRQPFDTNRDRVIIPALMTDSTPSHRYSRRFFASGFRIQTVAGETVALLLGWTRQGEDWRIYTYRVAAP